MTSPERAFLHELMNLLAIADGNCRKIQRMMKEAEPSEVQECLDKVQVSLDKIVGIARERREVIISEQEVKDNCK